MDPFNSEFSRLPYWNPLMTINTSGTCATSKLIQCRDFGCYQVDVSRKFDQDPEGVPDLSYDEFVSRKIVLEQVNDWVEKKGFRGKPQQWVPIAYLYEIVKASAKKTRDWGHLLFTDLTTTRFLIVMIFPPACKCGNYSHHDYDAMTKYQADRMLSLLKYLHHHDAPPLWVRATYVTPNNRYKLDPKFLNSTSSLSSANMRDRLTQNLPPIFHVTPDDFVASLLSSDVEKIDNMLKMKRSKKMAPPEVRKAVIGGKEAKPYVGSIIFNEKNARQCSFCDEMKEMDLMVCSRCKLVYYCSRECQRLAWPLHKGFCKVLTEKSDINATTSVIGAENDTEAIDTKASVTAVEKAVNASPYRRIILGDVTKDKNSTFWPALIGICAILIISVVIKRYSDGFF